MDFNSVQGKVVIVTGASRGIGRAIAECYGAHGMKVACAARSVDQGQAVSDGICAKGGEAPSKNWWTRPLPITESWTALSAMRASVWAARRCMNTM